MNSPAMHRSPRNVALASAESIRRDLVEAAATLYRLDVARWALRVNGQPVSPEVRRGCRAMADIASALAVDLQIEIEELCSLGMLAAARDFEEATDRKIDARCPGARIGAVEAPTVDSLYRRGTARRRAS